MRNLLYFLRSFGTDVPIFLRKIILDKSGREWLMVLLGNVLRLAIGFASSVLIARSLGPESFSLYAVLTGIIAISATICDAGLTNAAVKFIAPAVMLQPGQSRQFAGAFLVTKLALAATGTALGFVLSPHLSVWIWGNREFAPLVALSFLGVLTTAISNAIGALLQAARQFRTFAALQIFSPLLALIATATLLVSAALSVQSLIWITILVPLFTAGVGCINVKFFFPKKKEKNFRVWSLSLIAVRRLFAFSKWIFPAVAGGVLFSQLDLILARRWATSEAAGYYALALGLAMKAAVLNGSLETAFLPLAAEVKSATDLKRYRRSAFAKTAAASTLILAALPFTDFFIRIFYGETFRPATPLTQILLIMVLVNLNALPINLLAYPLDRPQWLALGQVGKALFFIMGARLAVATWGATGIAAAKLAAEILVAIFYLFLFRRAAFRFDSWRNFDERQIKTDRHSR